MPFVANHYGTYYIIVQEGDKEQVRLKINFPLNILDRVVLRNDQAAFFPQINHRGLEGWSVSDDFEAQSDPSISYDVSDYKTCERASP